jgi:hypothetical protein
MQGFHGGWSCLCTTAHFLIRVEWWFLSHKLGTRSGYSCCVTRVQPATNPSTAVRVFVIVFPAARVFSELLSSLSLSYRFKRDYNSGSRCFAVRWWLCRSGWMRAASERNDFADNCVRSTSSGQARHVPMRCEPYLFSVWF